MATTAVSTLLHNELTLLPAPLAPTKINTGVLLAKSSSSPAVLMDQDFDDAGAKWFKDVITFNPSNNRFHKSLGAAYILRTADKPSKGYDVGTIEAEEMFVRRLKDEQAALKKCLRDQGVKDWVGKEGNAELVGFVTAVRMVKNASYKRAELVDVGAGNWEVHRVIAGGEGEQKRRDSGLEVNTGSKWDVVGVEMKAVKQDESGEWTLGEELTEEQVAQLL